MWYVYLLAIVIILIILIIIIDLKRNNKRQKEKNNVKNEKPQVGSKEIYIKEITYEEKQTLKKIGGDDLLTVSLKAFEGAKNGNADDMVFLGLTIYKDVLRNSTKTSYWLKKAADAGNADGMYWYGECLVSGYGIHEDRTQGLFFIMDAAKKGNKEAINSLKENGMSIAEMRSVDIPV